MTHTVVGLFDSRSEAQAAMQELVQQGFIQEDIDLSNRSLADDSTTGTSSSYSSSSDTGIGDSISNFFSSLFSDDEQTANTYTNAAYDADAILTVQVDSEERARQASEILDRHGAIDVDERGAQYGSQNYASSTGYGSSTETDYSGTAEAGYTGTPGTTNTTGTAGTMDTSSTMETRDTNSLTGTTDTNYTTGTTDTARNTADLDNEAAIPVIEENLRVGKREVERGGARIRSRVIEKPVEATVRLREEHVVVNRRPVDRAATEADFNNMREGDIELTERAEVPVVDKQARVVEEVEIGKTVEEHDQTISDTVRRTDVEVDELSRDTDIDDESHTGTRRANS